jgi:hypothetical protein
MAEGHADKLAEQLRAGGWEVGEEAIGPAPPLVWLVRGERGRQRVEGLGLNRDDAWACAWRAAERQGPARNNG